MKRIEAFVKTDTLNAVVNALTSVGVGGLTVIRSQGKGAGERPEIQGGRGTRRYVAEYNNISTVLTIVDDSKVDSAITAITDAASTGKKGDGKIFVTTVDESVDIGTKKKGPDII